MKQDHEKFLERKAVVVVVARHAKKDVEEYWKKHELPFDGVPDPEKRIGELFGQEWKALKLGLMPALLVIDRGRRVAFAHYGSSMSDIPANEAVLAVLDGLERHAS
jgi:peroxiredoxin